MPKIFDNPKERADEPRETRMEHRHEATGSGPQGVNAKTENRITLVFIAVVMAVVLVIALLRIASGAVLPGHTQASPPTTEHAMYQVMVPLHQPKPLYL